MKKPSGQNMFERINTDSRVSKKVGPMFNSDTEIRQMICTAKDWCMYEWNIFVILDLLSLPNFQRLPVYK